MMFFVIKSKTRLFLIHVHYIYLIIFVLRPLLHKNEYYYSLYYYITHSFYTYNFSTPLSPSPLDCAHVFFTWFSQLYRLKKKKPIFPLPLSWNYKLFLDFFSFMFDNLLLRNFHLHHCFLHNKGTHNSFSFPFRRRISLFLHISSYISNPDFWSK